MVPARFGADHVVLGEVGWGPVFGDRLWTLPVRLFVCKCRDKCPKGDIPMMPMEVAAHWSEWGARCYLLHCCSTAGFDAVVNSPRWRSLAEEAAVKIKGSWTFLDGMSYWLSWGRKGE